MQETYIRNLQLIRQNRARLEKELHVKIKNKGRRLFIDGAADNEFLGLEVIEAINLGFSVDEALMLKKDEVILQVLNIKDITIRKNLEEIRGRIIGTHGRTLKTLNNITNCAITLRDNQIGIIGDTDLIEDAVQAMTSLVQGSKQGNVYGRIERRKKEKRDNPEEDVMDEIV